MGNLILSVIVVGLILGGPLTLYAIIKILNVLLGGLKVKFRSKEGSSDVHLQVSWDPESYDIQVSRVKIEYDELFKGGDSKMLSWTFEDSKAQKKSFVIPLKLSAEDAKIFEAQNHTDPRQARKSYFLVEVETVAGETQQFKLSKASVLKQLAEKIDSEDKNFKQLEAQAPDEWSVLTRVFPWRKAVEEEDEQEATAATGGAPKADEPRAPVDFKVTKVWIEPGCIVCDACENEAPAVFWVKEDTCIVRDNAPLDDPGAIKAAADGCPVDVIKFDSVKVDKAG